jgi:V8-like Glu-specific endopeptidase
MMMTKRFIAILLASFLSITLLGYWTNVSAQTPSKPATLPLIPAPKPVAITFNSKSDGTTFRPLDRPQSDNPFDPGDRAIISDDERLPVRSRAFPWSAIGQVTWTVPNTGTYTCTGTLISKDLVITNAHCLVENIDSKTGKLKQPIFFSPSMKEGKILEKEPAKVIAFDYGQEFQKGNIADDWAIFKLDKPLGEKYGYLGWRNLNLSDASVLKVLRDQIRLAGYSGDFPNQKLREQLNLGGEQGETAGVHVGCNIDGLTEDLGIEIDSQEIGKRLPGRATPGVIVHQCDTKGGASGSPIMALFNDNRYYIVGLHARFIPLNNNDSCDIVEDKGKKKNRGECLNGGVQVSRWAPKAISMRQE